MRANTAKFLILIIFAAAVFAVYQPAVVSDTTGDATTSVSALSYNARSNKLKTNAAVKNETGQEHAFTGWVDVFNAADEEINDDEIEKNGLFFTELIPNNEIDRQFVSVFLKEPLEREFRMRVEVNRNYYLFPETEDYTDNLSGNIEDLQFAVDDEEAGNAWYEAVNPEADTVLHIGFEDPAYELDGWQEIRVLLRRTDNSENEPEVSIELRQGGVLIDNLEEDQAVSCEEGEALIYNFNAGSLNDQTGSDLQLHLEGRSSEGEPGQVNTVEYGAIQWIAHLDDQ